MNLTRMGRRCAPALVVLTLLTARPAHAVSREMVELQTQVQQLIDSLARLQQSNDQQAGVLKDLVQQTVDSVNKMSVAVNGMQLKLQNQSDAQGAKSDQLSGQVQALNDSLDELKARMGRMEKTLNDLQSQAQTTAAALGNLPGAGGGGAASPAPASSRPSSPTAPPVNAPTSAPGGPITDNAAPAAPGAATTADPAAGDMYRAAYGDYMAGKYPLASSEFNDLIKAYPDDNLSGNAFFYLGEISNRTQKPSVAVKDYDQVLERYPDNAKIPAAHLHKGEALIALKDTASGERELRSLIQRFPNSPEAAQAKTKLTALNGGTRSRGRLE